MSISFSDKPSQIEISIVLSTFTKSYWILLWYFLFYTNMLKCDSEYFESLHQLPPNNMQHTVRVTL